LSGIDQKKVDEVASEKYFAAEKGEKKKGEEAFFKQGEKPEVREPVLNDILGIILTF
jgi:large subunit ribosomal protein L6e